MSRARTVLAGAAVVLVWSSSAAWADGMPAGAGPSNVSVSPSQVHQGATLKVTASGCTSGGTVTSAAFPAVQLPAGTTTTATARVTDTATPGAHTVTVRCGSRTANASFTVLAGTPARGGLGGSQISGTAVTAAGGAMAALAACTGAFLIVRRHRAQ
ncbi:hypothetical protein GCM10010271_29840 [Streptomyces kurssanovii]|nr:hypothetical protein GCM10010271_29840 [Streptomyces kurssanovii]